MSSKSMVGMFLANHSSIGLRSNIFRARRRKRRIQSGSPFIQDISLMTSSFRPFRGLNTYSSGSDQPSLYRPRSIVLVTAHRPPMLSRRSSNYHYVDSNNYPAPRHPDTGGGV